MSYYTEGPVDLSTPWTPKFDDEEDPLDPCLSAYRKSDNRQRPIEFCRATTLPLVLLKGSAVS